MKRRETSTPQKTHRKLGIEIIRTRARHRLAQHELASRCNVSARTLLRWENGYALPTREQLKALVGAFAALDPDDAAHVADTYGTSLDHLGIVTEEPEPDPVAAPPPVAHPSLPRPPREAAELALYVAADALELRAARLRAPIVTFLRTLGALGLTCEQACAMISPPAAVDEGVAKGSAVGPL
jgi:transcriptional regulator with XRE-family HTH domain